jgi:hypothetical protein
LTTTRKPGRSAKGRVVCKARLPAAKKQMEKQRRLEDFFESTAGQAMAEQAVVTPDEDAAEVDTSSDDIENDTFDKMLNDAARSRAKLLHTRGRRRLRVALERMAEVHQKVGSILPGHCLSYLELQSVKAGTLKQYLEGLGLAFPFPEFYLALASQAETETKLVELMNTQFYKGYGSKVLAALMALVP